MELVDLAEEHWITHTALKIATASAPSSYFKTTTENFSFKAKHPVNLVFTLFKEPNPNLHHDKTERKVEMYYL